MFRTSRDASGKPPTTLGEWGNVLRSQGYMSLGDPIVYYHRHKGIVELGLDMKKHKAQISFGSAVVVSQSSSPYEVVTSYGEEISTPITGSFKELADLHSLKIDQLDHNFDLVSYGRYIQERSKTRAMSAAVVDSILRQDKVGSETASVARKSVIDLLRKAPQLVFEPEKTACLARLVCLSTDEKLDFVDLPVSYILEAFSVPEHYEYITLPEETPPYPFARTIMKK